MSLKIAARQSELAREQAYQVGAALRAQHPGLEIEYAFRESLGDKNLSDPLWKLPEKGVFTEDFHRDLIEGRADLVVHSWKDLPVEVKAETRIAATLPRADQRDLLLFKRNSIGRPAARIYSSSPRRELHLSRFLKWALPGTPAEISFQSVRGNVPTRVRKWLESDLDGLIVAKAALDRLIASDFNETSEFLKKTLAAQTWMVIPLEECPNAPAQGALAVEIRRDREDLVRLLAPVHCADTFRAAETERQVLRRYGGGCHQKIGVACLTKPYGDVEILRGQTDQGEILDEKRLSRRRVLPEGLKPNPSVRFEARREDLAVEIPPGIDALWVAKAESLPTLKKFKSLIWVSGLETWKKLAAAGMWVHGSAESLGEDEDPRISILWGREPRWGRWTHDQAPVDEGKTQIPAYRVHLELKELNPAAGNFYYWRSLSMARLALEKHPELRHAWHACGPGRSFRGLRQLFGGEERIFVFLSENQFSAQ